MKKRVPKCRRKKRKQKRPEERVSTGHKRQSGAGPHGGSPKQKNKRERRKIKKELNNERY